MASFGEMHLSELKEIDISFATEKPRPEIRFLVLEQHVSKVQEKLVSLSKEVEISEFVSIEISPEEISSNPDGWFELLLTVDWMTVFSVMGAVSSIITIGTFLYRALNYLRKRYGRKEVRGLRINCTSSIAIAVNYLKSIGARITRNQIRLVYMSELLAYYCVVVFASPPTNPRELHIITTHIDGKVSSYSSVGL